MKLKNDFTLREITGDYIVVPTGENYLDFGAVISLNSSGAFLWKLLQNSATNDELVNAMITEYDIDRKTAEEDVAEFISLLTEHGLICNE